MNIDQNVLNAAFLFLLGIIGWFVRGTLSRITECQKHIERSVSDLSRSLEEWKILSVGVHEKLSGADAKLDLMHSQNQTILRDLTTKVDRTLESVPLVIAQAQSEIYRRIIALERDK